MKSFPKVLIFSHMAVNDTHGTGVLLKKYFENWPKENLYNCCVYNNVGVDFCRSVEFSKLSLEPGVFLSRIYRSLLTFHFKNAFRALLHFLHRIKLIYRFKNFRPDVVLALPINFSEIEILLDILHLFKGCPTVLKIWDWFPGDRNAATNPHLMEELVTRLHSVQLISKGIADTLPEVPSQLIQVEDIFTNALDQKIKIDHSEIATKAIMVGNVWPPGEEGFNKLVKFLSVWRASWAEADSKPPIVWYAHPESLQQLGLNAEELPEGLIYGGYYTGKNLADKLIKSDFIVVIVSVEKVADGDYAKYSVPSRLSEVCTLGLPIFMLGSEDCAAVQYIKEHGLGASCTADSNTCIDAIQTFVNSKTKREEYAANAVRHARNHFDLESKKRQIYELMCQASGKNFRSSDDADLQEKL